MKSNKKIAPATSRSRMLFEITSPQGRYEVVVTSAQEFKAALAFRLPELEPYTINALTDLVYRLNGSHEGKGWGVLYLGVLSLQTDHDDLVIPQKRRSKGAQVRPIPESVPPQQEATAGAAGGDTDPNMLF